MCYLFHVDIAATQYSHVGACTVGACTVGGARVAGVRVSGVRVAGVRAVIALCRCPAPACRMSA